MYAQFHLCLGPHSCARLYVSEVTLPCERTCFQVIINLTYAFAVVFITVMSTFAEFVAYPEISKTY